MDTHNLIQNIYQELFTTFARNTVAIAKYLTHYKSLNDEQGMSSKLKIPVITIDSCLHQLQKLGLVRLGSPILIDKIGIGRFSNNLRRQQDKNGHDIPLSQLGYRAVVSQIKSPKIDGVYYNLTNQWKERINKVLHEFKMIRSPQIYIEALIILSKSPIITEQNFYQQLGENNDADTVVAVLHKVHLIRKKNGSLYANKYRLHITINWFISEGSKDHGRLLDYNMQAIIAQQLFNFS